MKLRKRVALAPAAALALLTLSAPAAGQETPAYTTFVACGYDVNRPETIRRTHFCPAGEIVGAFFRRNVGRRGSLIRYTVCVGFSRGGVDCESGQPARKLGTRLYVNRIINPGPGRHRVTWFVKGKRVGLWFFRRGR
jgi:hypothetical protein